MFGATPLTFPIEWHNSKIPAVAGRVSVPNIHGFSALFVFSSVTSRFFNPQLGGAGAVPPGTGGAGNTPFRIDHDEKFNQTTHLQYQPWKRGPWVGFNWRYDSGLVAGSVAAADHLPQPVVGAMLIGVDLGPNLSVTGSLATILWLVALRREKIDVSFWRFLKIGAIMRANIGVKRFRSVA